MNILHLLTDLLNITWIIPSSNSFPWTLETTLEGEGELPSPRIFGGFDAAKDQFPYILLAVIGSSKKVLGLCTASLIKPKLALLAAHCVVEADDIDNGVLLVSGLLNGHDYIKKRDKDFEADLDLSTYGCEERRSMKVFYHPSYSTNTFKNDVAVVHFNNSFTLPGVKFIALSKDRVKKRIICTIVGYGQNMSDSGAGVLRYHTDMEIFTSYGNCKYRFLEPFLCLRTSDVTICPGDSGGPLVCDNKVWGINSHGLNLKGDKRCGKFSEAYFTELYLYTDWVEKGDGQMLVSKLKILIIAVLPLFSILTEFRIIIM